MTNPTEHNLTQKQFLFCEYLIQTRNGTKSSRLAEYKCNTDNAHAANASRLLRNDKVQAYLSKRYAETCMASDEVLSLLAKIARTDISSFVNKGGGIDWQKVTEDGYAVKSISHTFGRNSKIETEPRLKALELIGRSTGMFIDKIAPTDPTGTKEFGADIRSDLISKLLPGIAAAGTIGATEEADD